MNHYIVKSPIKYKREIHPVGASVELDPATAARALAKGSVALAPDPREAARAMNDAIRASAALVVAGTLTVDQAAEQIASQAQGAVYSQIREALQDQVDEAKQRAADEARALEAAIDAQAARVVADELSHESAADQVVAQIPSAQRADVLARLQGKVEQLKLARTPKPPAETKDKKHKK